MLGTLCLPRMLQTSTMPQQYSNGTAAVLELCRVISNGNVARRAHPCEPAALTRR